MINYGFKTASRTVIGRSRATRVASGFKFVAIPKHTSIYLSTVELHYDALQEVL